MTKLSRISQASPMRLRLALTCAVSALAACSQQSATSNTTQGDNSLADAPPPASALPMATGPAPAYGPAPAANALPPAPRAHLGRTAPADQYAYLNQAYAFSQSLADAPPDYTYDYQGERPWVWQSPDGYYRVAEQLPMGVRYFYYAPGASQPYLVQDPQYSYGYSGGMLTVVYGPDGEVLPDDVQARQAQAAGLYLAWAAGLYAAARHEQHVGVSQDRWDAERQAVYADQARWNQAQQRNAAWADYSQAHQNDQAHWVDQRYVRAAEAARFAEAVHDQTALAHAQQAASEARTIAQSHGQRPPGPPQDGGFGRRGPEPAPPGAPENTPANLTGAQRQPPPQRPLAPGQQGAQVSTQGPSEMQSRPRPDVPRPGERPGAAQDVALGRVQPPVHPAADGRRAAAYQVPARLAPVQRAPVQQEHVQRAQVQEAEVQQARPREAQAKLAAAQTAAIRQPQAQVHDQQAAAHQSQAAAAAQRASADRAAVVAQRPVTELSRVQVHTEQTAPAVENRKTAPVEPSHPGAPPAKPRPDTKGKPDEHHP